MLLPFFDTEATIQLLEFTVTSQEETISDLKIAKLQLEENAKFNFAHLLSVPDGSDAVDLQLHLNCQEHSQLRTRPEYQNSPDANNLLPGYIQDDICQAASVHGDVCRAVPHVADGDGHLPHSTSTTSCRIHPGTSEKNKVRLSKPGLTRDMDKASISYMTKVIDDLAIKYNHPNLSKKKSPGKRPAIVPKIFSAIWKLLLKPSPTMPTDPCPIVDWTKVRPKPGIPDPEFCPVLSASQDPDYYTSPAYINGINHRVRGELPTPNPFGTLPGYHTNLGIIAVPDHPVNGFIYCLEMKKWILHSSLSTISGGRSTAWRGTPVGTGRERRRR